MRYFPRLEEVFPNDVGDNDEVSGSLFVLGVSGIFPPVGIVCPIEIAGNVARCGEGASSTLGGLALKVSQVSFR